MKNLSPKKQGELSASDAVKLFDNVTDDAGEKLIKSQKRARLRIMFIKLCQNEQENACALKDGRVVPIIVKRKEEGRGAFHYLNTADAPLAEIAKEFAKKCHITYRGDERPEPKKIGELIAADVKHLFDNVTSDNKKLSGFKKQDKLQTLFQKLYENPEENLLSLNDGTEIPVIVKRIGVNNREACCLNASEHRAEVLSAFAAWAGCDYLIEKETAITPPKKQKGELTARECARIFHQVENKNANVFKRHASERIKDWFSYIYTHQTLNKTKLPNGSEAELVIYRQSYAQKCFCLNTADEIIKPFVIKRVAEITNAEVCFKNLKL